jgi:signal transduction histidine kinase
MDTSGTVISLVAEGRDITERRKAEEALRAVNKKLKLLSSITRHDILNNVTVMLGFLELARDHSKHPEMERFIGRLETKTRQIRSQIQFTQLYEDIGSHEPQWQDLHQELAKLQVPPGITFSDNCTTQEIFADRMLEKVFCNLLDNSVRHGGHITRVMVSCHESDAGLTITWEDDGSGVPAGEKEKIFERGFGKNTGLGLFLVREILDITGITIRETGEPGKGARFEIHVPNGAYT